MRINPLIPFLLPFLLLLTISTAQQMPRLVPEAYWGTAMIDGNPAPKGSEITVEIQNTGEVVGKARVMDDNGLYSLDIIFDNELTEEDEGAEEGQPLLWRINGIPCDKPASDTANSGGVNTNFTISAGGETDHPASIAMDSDLLWSVLAGILILAGILLIMRWRYNKK